MIGKIRSILNDETKSLVDRYVELYKNILSDDGQDSYLNLKSIIEIAKAENLSDESEDDNRLVQDLAYRYFRLLRELVRSITRQNLIPEAFYETLYKYVFLSEMFPEDAQKKGILLYFIAQKMRPYLPYYQAHNPVVLENDAFDMIMDDINEELEKAIYMMNRSFNSLSEEASQLCDIADSIDGREKRAVFWSCIINAKRRKIEQSVESD